MTSSRRETSPPRGFRLSRAQGRGGSWYGDGLFPCRISAPRAQMPVALGSLVVVQLLADMAAQNRIACFRVSACARLARLEP